MSSNAPAIPNTAKIKVIIKVAEKYKNDLLSWLLNGLLTRKIRSTQIKMFNKSVGIQSTVL